MYHQRPPHAKSVRPVGGETAMAETVRIVASEEVVAARQKSPGIELSNTQLIPELWEVAPCLLT